MKIKNVVKLVRSYVKTALEWNKKNIKYPVLYIVGGPGIGKSTLIESVAQELQMYLKVVYLSNVALEQITGLPLNTSEDGSTTWSRPDIISDLTDEPTILFFDDAHLVNKIKQEYLFQLLTYRAINKHKIPQQTVMLFAGNRLQDKAGANPLPAPVVNRFQFIEMEVTSDEWLSWANGKVSPYITGFIKYKPTCLQSKPLENTPFATPRAWDYLSQSLQLIDQTDIDSIKELVVVS